MRVTATQGPQGGGKTAQNREARLRRAAVQFESLFLQQMLRSMRATVPESGLLDGGGEMKLYRQMLDEELAKNVAGDSRFGIADLLVRRYLPLLEQAEDTVQRPEMATRDGKTGSGERTQSSVLQSQRPAVTRNSVRARLAQATAAYGSLQPAEDGSSNGGIAAALRERAARMGGAVADTLRRFAAPIAQAAQETGLPPSLLLSVVATESGGRPAAVSPRGAQGLMQLMPETAAEVGVDDPFDPAQNLLGGARYLASLRERFNGDLTLTLAGYNAGPGNVEQAGRVVPPFAETQRYVAKVLDLYRQLDPGAASAQEVRDDD